MKKAIEDPKCYFHRSKSVLFHYSKRVLWIADHKRSSVSW